MAGYPNSQSVAGGAIPVWLTAGGAGVDTANPLPVDILGASISATVPAEVTVVGFAPDTAAAGQATLGADTAGGATTLPATDDVVFFNTGTVGVDLALGASSTVASAAAQFHIPGESWAQVARGSNTWFGAVALSGDTTVLASGGVGQYRGAGGGAGGSGSTSGSVTVAGATGTSTPAASPADMLLGGARYNATPPALTNGQAAALQADSVGALKVDIGAASVTALPVGLGALTAVPSATANGAALGTPPAGTKGARLYLPSGSSVTFTIASAAPSSPPSLTFTVSGDGTGPNWDEDLSSNEMIYVTAKTGSPLFRWF